MPTMPLKHKEKLNKAKIALNIRNKKWSDIAEEVNNLRIKIKNEVKEYVTPRIKNDESIILQKS